MPATTTPSPDDIANDLVYDSWDGDWHRFEIGTDGSLTVNVTGNVPTDRYWWAATMPLAVVPSPKLH